MYKGTGMVRPSADTMIRTTSGLAGRIDAVTTVVIIVLVVVSLLAAVGGIVFYWQFKKKRRARMEDLGTDYSELERRDAGDYVKLDDIKDNMIITDGGNRFVAVIRCSGYDYYSAHVAERMNTQSGYRAFINTFSRPITYRQFSRNVDLDHTKKKYEASLKRIEIELFHLTEDFGETKRALEEYRKQQGKDAENDREILLFVEALEQMRTQMENLEWRKYHLEDQIVYIDQISGEGADPNRNETYVFDWTYRPLDFPYDLSEHEIYDRAMQELDSQAQKYIHALSVAGIKAVRCTTRDLIEMNRRMFQPITSERCRLEQDPENGAFYRDIIYTENRDELQEEAAETLALSMLKSVEEAAESVKSGMNPYIAGAESGDTENEQSA